MRPGKRRENGEKKGGVVAAATILNRRAEVGDGRWCGTTWRARAERWGERGGFRPTSGRRPIDSSSRPTGAGGAAWPCHSADRIGEGKGGLTGGLWPQCRAAALADR
jgi:hypothetical protein